MKRGKFAKVFAIIIAILVCITGFTIIYHIFGKSEKNAEIVYDEYITEKGGYPYGYMLDMNTSSTSEEMKGQNMLYVPSSEEEINCEFGVFGDDPKVAMQVFYDYRMVKFRPGNSTEYMDKYVFYLKDGEKVKVPIKLDKNVIQKDNKIHKLLVSFISGYGQNAMEYEETSEEFGGHYLFDIIHTLDYENEVAVKGDGEKYIEPEKIFKDNYSFVLNTDYDNVGQKPKKNDIGAVGILYPDSEIKAKANTKLDLMYNIGNQEGYEDCLILMTANYQPIKINSNGYQAIKYSKKEGTINGRISISVPSQKGHYEIISYLINEPFKAIQGDVDKTVPEISPRFTLTVE